MRKHKNEIVTHRKPSLGLSLIPILSVFILLLLALLKYRVDYCCRDFGCCVKESLG